MPTLSKILIFINYSIFIINFVFEKTLYFLNPMPFSVIVTGQRFSLRSNRNIEQTTMSISKPNSKQVRIYQPTYQLKSRKPFNTEVVEKILKRIVSSELEEVEYSEKQIPDLCLTLAENVRAAIKEENYDRYRIIVAVTIGQRRQQSVHIFHSFLWDHERDAFATYNFENCHIYANVVVYGVYFD